MQRSALLCWVIALALACSACVCTANNEDPKGDTAFLDDVAEDRDGLQSLLNWAIENSSPEALSELAHNVGQDLPDATLEEHRARLSEFVQDSKMWPSDSEIMNTTLKLVGNRSEPESTRVQGLRMLQDIVEDTLLANELPALGGVDVLADAMLEGGAVRLQAMRVLATAASNNVPFQEAVLQREAGSVQWLLQAAADALYATPVDTELLSVALKATAAMARNLPPLTTGLLRAHIAHLRPAEAPPPTGADPVDQLPESLQLLFEVVVELQGQAGAWAADGDARARRNAANAAVGLISDLAVNSQDVRVVLQGAQAAAAWTGACKAVSGGKLDMVQKVVQLLANMHEPHPAPTHTAADAWHAAGDCLEKLRRRVEAEIEAGEDWAREVLQDVHAARKALPSSPVRDEL